MTSNTLKKKKKEQNRTKNLKTKKPDPPPPNPPKKTPKQNQKNKQHKTPIKNPIYKYIFIDRHYAVDSQPMQVAPTLLESRLASICPSWGFYM